MFRIFTVVPRRNVLQLSTKHRLHDDLYQSNIQKCTLSMPGDLALPTITESQSHTANRGFCANAPTSAILHAAGFVRDSRP